MQLCQTYYIAVVIINDIATLLFTLVYVVLYYTNVIIYNINLFNYISVLTLYMYDD